MPKLLQYKIVKAQVESFLVRGFLSVFHVQGFEQKFAASVLIYNPETRKSYRFSDEDWNVVSMQIAQLYSKLFRKF